MKKIIVFDCDSTLSCIEGIDELGRILDAETFAEVERLTNDAMDGKLPLDEVFPKRMLLISPNAQESKDIAQMYIDQVESTAISTLATLREQGWTLMILSGGFAPLIQPLADLLEIEEVHAVPIYFDAQGNYASYGADYPTTRNQGKVEIINDIKQRHQPEQIIMVGDGISDLETKPVVDKFIGFSGFIARDKVVAEADYMINSLDELLAII